MILPIFVSKKM